MRFHYRRTERDSESFFHEALFLDEQGKIVLALQVEENTVEAWEAGLRKMQEAPHSYYQNLSNRVDDLEKCDYDDLPTLWRIIFALRQIMKKKRNEAAAETLTACLRKWFSFEAEYNKTAGAYQYLVCAGGEMIFLQRHSLTKHRSAPKSIPVYLFSADIADLQKQHPEKFNSLLQNYERLLEASTYHRAAKPGQRKFILQSFVNFSKALIDFLDKNEELRLSVETTNAILSVVVKNEDERLDDQQIYLKRILESRENEDRKCKRLEDIAKDVCADIQSETGAETRLISILGTISAYYLRRYDFDRTVDFWRLLDKKDWLLRQILKLYDATGKYVAIIISGMTIGMLLTYLNAHSNIFVRDIISSLLFVIFLPVFLTVPAIAGFVFYRFVVVKKGPEYIELFFPRLLGAIVIGLSVLLFQNTSWDFGLKLDWINLIFIYLLIYPLAFLYIFIIVRKDLRYLPYHKISRNEKDFKLKVTSKQDQHSSDSSMAHSISASLKVFYVGLLESFFVILLTSSVFYTGALENNALNQYIENGLGIIVWNIHGIVSIGFFPTLVVLWTGLSLLIGTFAQLLGQDRQIGS